MRNPPPLPSSLPRRALRDNPLAMYRLAPALRVPPLRAPAVAPPKPAIAGAAAPAAAAAAAGAGAPGYWLERRLSDFASPAVRSLLPARGRNGEVQVRRKWV